MIIIRNQVPNVTSGTRLVFQITKSKLIDLKIYLKEMCSVCFLRERRTQKMLLTWPNPEV